ncbi:membrane protein, partial [Helicobacter pylori PZ5004]
MPIDLNEHLKKKNSQRENPTPNTPNNRGRFIPPSNSFNSKKLSVLIVIVLLGVIAFLAKPFEVISSGEIGIKITAGKYEPTPLQPGIHFFVPIIQDILIVDTRIRNINFSRTEDMGVAGKNQGIFRNDAINVMDSRGLTVSIELTVQYRLNPQT